MHVQPQRHTLFDKWIADHEEQPFTANTQPLLNY